ncbi:MAG: hypothetical protein P8Y74_18390, partial [Desulfobacterales bacterium]
MNSDGLLKGIDLNLRLNSPTTDAAKRFLIDWLPEIGPVHGEGRLQGSAHQLGLEELSIVINEAGPLSVASQGRIGRIPTKRGDRISKLDLGISVQAEKTTLLAKALGLSLPKLGATSARFRVYYTAGKLRFDEVEVKTTDRNGLETAFSGSVGDIPNKEGQPYGDVDFRVRMTAPDLGAAEPLLGTRIITDVGPVVGEARVVGTTDVLSLKNLVLTAGRPGRAHMEMHGVTDCNIEGSIQFDEASKLALLSGLSPSHLGPLQGSWRLVDRNGGFGIDDAKLSIGAKESFLLEAAGNIESISRKGVIALSGAEFDISASAVDIKAVPVLADLGLPDLVPLKMSAKLRAEKDRLDLERMVINAGSAEASGIAVEGDIHKVGTNKNTKIIATFETHTRPWMERILRRSVAESHKLIGRLTLIPEPRQLRIAKLVIAVDDQQTAALQASGLAKKLNGSIALDVKVSVAADKPSVFGSMVGVPLPSLQALSADGRLQIAGKKTDFEGSLRFGKTVLETAAHSFIRGHRPHLDLVINSPVVYLADLGITPQESVAEAEKKTPTKREQAPLFSKKPWPFDMFREIDLTLGFNADKLVGNN